jgi:UDP-GlcNAc3NAcA epimerase
MKIVTVIGARPQFIKAAVMSGLLQQTPGVVEVLVHTGQHYDDNMSDIFFTELQIPRPNYHLGVGSGGHGQQTGQMLDKVEEVLLAEKPDAVLVYGDTNSTLAGTLAAAKLHIPVAHVEAGLRSFNRRMPEEINRVLTDHLARWLFAPTQTAVENLAREGIVGEAVHLVGDVMYDAAQRYGSSAPSTTARKLGLATGDYILATIHRAENTDSPDRLQAIFSALCEVARQVPVVLPLHPRTRGALRRAGLDGSGGGRLHLVDPVGFLEMVRLEKGAQLIVTDSGGVQKEAFFHRVPCVTLRDETEWVELVQIGWNRLLPPTTPAAIRDGILGALESPLPPSPPATLYGGGQAANRIVRELC